MNFMKLANNVTKTHEIQAVLTDQYSGIKSKKCKQFLKNTFLMVFTDVESFSNDLNERLNY